MAIATVLFIIASVLMFIPTYAQAAAVERNFRRALPKTSLHRPRVVALSLQGDPGCDYTTKVNIGGTVLNLIIDTGSSNLAVAAEHCTTCKSVPLPRYPNKQASVGNVGVTYGTPQNPTSWSGVITVDTIRFPEMDSVEETALAGPLNGGFNATLAAITENVNFFNPLCTESHGIWGLAHENLAAAEVTPLFDTIIGHGVPDGFAMQLCPVEGVYTSANYSEQRSGHLWLGGLDSSKIDGEMQYVPVVARDWYQVKADSIEIDGKGIPGMLPLSAPKSIVDSGTTDIILSDENYGALVAALYASNLISFSKRVPPQYVHNFWYRGSTLRIPLQDFHVNASVTVAVVIDGISISIDHGNLIKSTPYRKNSVDLYWAGFSPGGPQGSGVGTILGETLFVGKVVFFDRVPSNDAPLGRIGFAKGRACREPTSGTAIDVFAGENSTLSEAPEKQSDDQAPKNKLDIFEETSSSASRRLPSFLMIYLSAALAWCQ